MVVDVLEPNVQVDHDPVGPSRRRVLTWVPAGVLCVAIFVAAMVFWTRSPHLDSGSSSRSTPDAKIVSDGYSDTKFVVNGNAGGVLHVSVRNDSRVPVTIIGLDKASMATLTQLTSIRFQANPNGPGAPKPWASQVTLGQGDEASVDLTVQTPACLPMSKGSSSIYDWIPVKVRRLGISHSARIPLDLPLWIYTTKDHPGVVGCHEPTS